MTPRTTAFSALTGEQQQQQQQPGPQQMPYTPAAGPSQPSANVGTSRGLPFRRQWEELKADIR